MAQPGIVGNDLADLRSLALLQCIIRAAQPFDTLMPYTLTQRNASRPLRRHPTFGTTRVAVLGALLGACTVIAQAQNPVPTPTPATVPVPAPIVVPVQPLAPAATDGQWRGNGGAGLSATSGNSNTTTFTLNAEGSRATLADRIAFGTNANYGRSKSNGITSTTANKWSGFGQYDYNLSPRVYSFAKLNLEGDELLRLDLRASAAGGLGYKLVDTDPARFSVFGGAGYSRDQYAEPQTVDGRSSTRFSRTSVFVGEESFQQLTPSTTFKQRLDLYGGISGDEARIAKFTAGLAVAMTRTWSLTLDLVDNYNSRPPAGFKSNDAAIFTGVSFKLGAR